MHRFLSWVGHHFSVKAVSWLILVAGILIRMVVYLQNRNLIIDEANLARNVYERGLGGLAQTLAYEQYAPPVFLWLTKAVTVFAGYSEYALRFLPLMAGIGSLFLLRAILGRLEVSRGLWYPLFMLASGMIYVRYATEFKQYASDSFIALLLVWLALRVDIARSSRTAFVLVWVLAGSAAVWLSMPSVFVLAGVGCYYLYPSLRDRQMGRVAIMGLIAMVWILQFFIYYQLLLRPDIQSDYLQQYHKNFFLFLLPASAREWAQNGTLLMDYMGAVGGHWATALILNLSLLVVGIVSLFRRQAAVGLLLLVPVVGMCAAAGLKQYSLIPRLTLFSMPLVLLLMGLGMERVLRLRLLPLRVAVFAFAFVNMFNFAANTCSQLPLELEEVTTVFDFIQDRKIPADAVYIRHQVVPAFIYYTTIHPRQEKWAAIKDAQRLTWDSDCGSLARQIQERRAYVFSWDSPEDQACRAAMYPNLSVTDSLDRPGYKAYVYRKL